MEDVISRIISDLEGIHNLNPQTPISEQTLLDLQTIVDHQTLNDDGDPDQISPLWEKLSSRNLSLSSIISPITSAMESGSIPLSLLSSKVYLSLILSPNSPTLGLFTPMAFNSLLRAIRRAFKDGRGPYTSSDNRRKGFGSSHRRGKGKRSLNSDEEEREREKNELDVRLLFNVLDRLGLVMGLLHLERFPDSLKSLVQTVAEIPVLGSELCGNSGNYKKLSDLCMRVLDEVLSNEYGDTAATAAEVLKFLSPLILMLNSQARTFALGFVIHRMMVMKKNSDAINKAVVNLPRYLLQKAPEKSEARALAVQSIMEIVKAMHFEDQVGFLDYVSKMAQGKAHLRLLAVDLFPLLLVSLREPSGLVLDDKVEDSWRWRCLGALIERCSDANAGIRARALLNIAQLVGNLSSGEQGRAMLKKLMALKNGNSNNKQEGGMNDLLRKRCRDEKAAVRKAAILVISKLVTLGGGLDGDILKAVGIACSDSLVSIRKAAVSALSEAFRNTSDTSVIIEWLHSVPRLITDSEASIQEECENFFLELVLDRVSRAGSVQLLSQPVTHNSNVNRENLDREMAKLCPNGVFDLLKEICNGEVAPWVKKICRSLVKKNKLKPKIATALQNIISTSESLWLSHSMSIENWTAPRGAWLLLSEVSSFLPKAVNWEFLHHHWQLLDKNGVESEFKIPPREDRGEGKESMESDSVAWASDRVLLLQTIAKVSVELPPEPAAELAHNLFKRLEKFNMHLTEVNAHVQALKTLCKRKALNPEEADALVTKWVHQILTKALRIIQAYLSDEPEFSIENAFVTPTASVSKNGKRAVALSRRLCQATTAVYTIGSLVIICPSIDLKEIIPVLLSIITSGSPELRPNGLPGSTASLKQKAPSLFIQAWVTMGKICLADGKLAKRYIPLFVQELEKSDCAALRNNIIVTMADFCVRYTALVDCYIAKITKCLRDPCELVRRQTFILLSRLLQRDYVKWRGILFLRFLLSLVDESEKIRQLADFLFGNILKAKAPLLAYNSFVEAVFVLNDCHHSHMGHGSSQNSRVENRLFSIRGNDEKSRSERMHIYVSLLKQMSPEHLLATFAKICAEILATASDGVLRIEDAPGQAVLQDAFQILTCKEIRIASSRGSSSDSGEVEEEGGDGGPASSSAARGRVITQAVKKSLIQNTIPIFIELKRLLESKNSPLIGSLMECLRLLLKDYKNEIDDLLVADKQLQKELIYDMQKYETGKARSTATEAVVAVQRSAGYQASGVRMSASEASAREPSKKLKNDPKVASAMAEVAAAAKARSVLREVNQGASTPPLSSIKVPKLKFSRRLASPAAAADARGDRCVDLLQSVRRRHTFTDEEN